MICGSERKQNGLDSCVFDHVVNGINEVCGGSVVMAPEKVDEIANAIEHYIQETSDSPTVNSSQLVMLASQALFSVGENCAARRMILFGSRQVKPSYWEVTGNETMWILDLKGISLFSGTFLEIEFFNCLMIVIDSIADVWDESLGRGAFGLKNVITSLSILLGIGGDSNGVLALSSEIRRTCSDKLEKLKRERGWDTVPSVLNLDLNR